MSQPTEESVRSDLMEIYPKIRDLSEEDILSGPSDPLQEPFCRLAELAAFEVEDRVVNALLCDPEMKPVLEAVARLRRVYGLRLEIEQARSILESSNPWKTLKSFAFYRNYLILAKTEFVGAGLNPGETVAFLGSGPLPSSLIVLCHEYGLKGIGIERVPEWAEISREVLQRLGLSSKIEILDGDHHAFPLERDCQLVMVAAAAQPKEEILNHLARVLPPGARISYRIYEKGLRRILDLDSDPPLPKGLFEHLRVRPDPPVNNTSVLLIKGSRSIWPPDRSSFEHPTRRF